MIEFDQWCLWLWGNIWRKKWYESCKRESDNGKVSFYPIQVVGKKHLRLLVYVDGTNCNNNSLLTCNSNGTSVGSLSLENEYSTYSYTELVKVSHFNDGMRYVRQQFCFDYRYADFACGNNVLWWTQVWGVFIRCKHCLAWIFLVKHHNLVGQIHFDMVIK